jgi:hypothetical protein
MIYVIGTDHIFQYRHSSETDQHLLADAFLLYLRQVAESFNAQVIAEEFSIEAFADFSKPPSIAQEVAADLGIEHRYCDPTQSEREKLSISSSDLRRREQHWLDSLRDCCAKTIVFICGASHTTSFQSLLSETGIEAHILCENWGGEYLGAYYCGLLNGLFG